MTSSLFDRDDYERAVAESDAKTACLLKAYRIAIEMMMAANIWDFSELTVVRAVVTSLTGVQRLIKIAPVPTADDIGGAKEEAK